MPMSPVLGERPGFVDRTLSAVRISYPLIVSERFRTSTIVTVRVVESKSYRARVYRARARGRTRRFHRA